MDKKKPSPIGSGGILRGGYHDFAKNGVGCNIGICTSLCANTSVSRFRPLKRGQYDNSRRFLRRARLVPSWEAIIVTFKPGRSHLIAQANSDSQLKQWLFLFKIIFFLHRQSAGFFYYLNLSQNPNKTSSLQAISTCVIIVITKLV